MPPTFTTRRRIVVLFLGLMLASGALLVRTGYVGLWLGPGLAQEGLSVRLRSIPVTAPRGEIVDQNGTVLAGSKPIDAVYAIPAQVVNASRTASLLSPILDRSEETLAKLLGRRASVVWLKRRLPTDKASEVKSLELPGVGVITSSQRYYPQGELAARILGYTGIDNQGLDGVELMYDKALSGTPGAVQVELDAVNRPIPGVKEHFRPPVPGDTLKLTVDLPIQKIAQKAAQQALSETGAASAGVLVMDVRTGGILALAAAPGFNPNSYATAPASALRDPLVSDTFPPGSTFKIITASAALESGVVNLNTSFYDPGFVRVNGRRLRCWKAGGHGSVPFTEVVHGSCNVGFVDMGLRLGVSRFFSYLNRFHLIGRTGVDLPGEAKSIVPPLSRVTPIDLATMSFGQTLSLTPIQLLSAVSAVADGGVWHQPHVMDEIVAPDGTVVQQADDPGQRVLKASVASELNQVLGGVIAEGTGKKAKVYGYDLAGKTGTAQAVINGRYVQGKYVASFVGFGPLPNPRVAALVMINQPQGMYYGGQIAAPVFSQVMGQVLNALDVPPNPAVVGRISVPNMVGKGMTSALSTLKKAKLRARVIGQGSTVTSQFPQPGTVVPKDTAVLLFGTVAKEATVPDLTGKDVASALEALDRAGLMARVNGTGRVERQEPAPGAKVQAGATVTLWASPSVPEATKP